MGTHAQGAGMGTKRREVLPARMLSPALSAVALNGHPVCVLTLTITGRRVETHI